tara:strand:+ start:712 stop:1143 length:432 start_codon:yes stop_codon:yes gene_type:complete
MKHIIKNIIILLLPFTLMILVNELCRPLVKEKPYEYKFITAINSKNEDLNKCTWACHNISNHCTKNHVRRIINPNFPFFEEIDCFYKGIINFNNINTSKIKISQSESYAAMNLIFLVLLWPLLMYFLLLNYLRLRKKIKKLKS